MKRITASALALVLLLILCACGGNGEQTKVSDTPEEETQAVESEQLVVKLGETVSTDQVEFKLTRFDFASRVYRPLGAEKERALEPIPDDKAEEYSDRVFCADGALVHSPYRALKPEDGKVLLRCLSQLKTSEKHQLMGISLSITAVHLLGQRAIYGVLLE